MIKLTSSDLITLIIHSEQFNTLVTKILGDKLMALKTDIETLKAKIAANEAAVEAEFNEVKDILIALKQSLADLEGIDLSEQIATMDKVIAKVAKISEADIPEEEEPPVPVE